MRKHKRGSCYVTLSPCRSVICGFNSVKVFMYVQSVSVTLKTLFVMDENTRKNRKNEGGVAEWREVTSSP